jgi:hypothetical protein
MAVLLTAASGCTDERRPPEPLPAVTSSAGAPLPAPRGFRAELVHSGAPSPERPGMVSWTTNWRLTWQPVPGADTYGIYYRTGEGAAPSPSRTTREPAFELQVAAGLSTPDRLTADRAGQLGYRGTQLGVVVAALAADGTPGTPSDGFAVGIAHPSG